MISTWHQRPLRESWSVKQHEKYIYDDRDKLCNHYRLNKSDLIKYLIKKDIYNLKNINSHLIQK